MEVFPGQYRWRAQILVDFPVKHLLRSAQKVHFIVVVGADIALFTPMRSVALHVNEGLTVSHGTGL